MVICCEVLEMNYEFCLNHYSSHVHYDRQFLISLSVSSLSQSCKLKLLITYIEQLSQGSRPYGHARFQMHMFSQVPLKAHMQLRQLFAVPVACLGRSMDLSGKRFLTSLFLKPTMNVLEPIFIPVPHNML